MNELLWFVTAILAVLLVPAGGVVFQRLTRDRDQQEIRRLTAREAELAAELIRQRERRCELTTARDAAGYIDRSFMEADRA